MTSTLRIALFAGLTLSSLSAHAQTVVFRENWESGTGKWRTTGPSDEAGHVYLRDTGATQGTPVVLNGTQTSADPSTCGGAYAREGVGKGNESVGGRVFLTAASAISVGAPDAFVGKKYCVAAWIRGDAGAKPALGINFIKKSLQYSDTRAAAGAPYRSSTYREHWLTTHISFGSADSAPWGAANGTTDTRDGAKVTFDRAEQNKSYGNSSPSLAPVAGQWNLVKSWFTVTEQDLRAYETSAGGTDVAADAFVLKFGNFTGSGTIGTYSADTKPAEFGDIVVVQLAPTATECPGDDFFAPITSVHKACKGAAPLCITTGAGDTSVSSCGACDASKGESGTNVCGDAAPVCEKAGANTGACSTCTADNGVAGRACAASAPYCSTKAGAADLGTCGKCTKDADCLTALGGKDPSHAGVTCDVPSGACTTGCFDDIDCAPTNGWCDGATKPTISGKCKPKLANGVAVPASRGGQCNQTTGTNFCEAGQCDVDDDKCGLVNKFACTLSTQCRGGVCEAGFCGRTDGGACTKNEQCKGNECTAGKCQAPCTSDDACVDGSVCDVDGTKACVVGCRGAGGKGCPTGRSCSSTDVSIGTCAATPVPVTPPPVLPKTPVATPAASDPKSGCSTAPSNGAGGFSLMFGIVAAGLVRRRLSDARRAKHNA